MNNFTISNVGINLKITVGIPAFNEEKNIAAIIVKLKKIADNVIVCNDGSTDATGIIAEELGAIVNQPYKKSRLWSRNTKYFFKIKRKLNQMFWFTLDSDGQHDVDEIKKLIEPIENKKCDLVIGSRFLEDNVKNVPNYRKIGINIITKVTNTTLKNKLTDSQSGYRAYNKKVISEITPIRIRNGCINRNFDKSK